MKGITTLIKESIISESRPTKDTIIEAENFLFDASKKIQSIGFETDYDQNDAKFKPYSHRGEWSIQCSCALKNGGDISKKDFKSLCDLLALTEINKNPKDRFDSEKFCKCGVFDGFTVYLWTSADFDMDVCELKVVF